VFDLDLWPTTLT